MHKIFGAAIEMPVPMQVKGLPASPENSTAVRREHILLGRL
jgi:hypothetical protein